MTVVVDVNHIRMQKKKKMQVKIWWQKKQELECFGPDSARLDHIFKILKSGSGFHLEILAWAEEFAKP